MSIEVTRAGSEGKASQYAKSIVEAELADETPVAAAVVVVLRPGGILETGAAGSQAVRNIHEVVIDVLDKARLSIKRQAARQRQVGLYGPQDMPS